ncbi:hypothetical protein [Rhodoflexus caldus]|uniref:hypothetical protein n=1 Tax=Rhodoflexus caldus TaxID=2891236 RepID=UPI00202A9344|nr:hypothetical protein [Rhodoflexus caldus]
MKYRLIIAALALSWAVVGCTDNKNTAVQENTTTELAEEEADPWANMPETEEDMLPEAPLKELIGALKDSVERNWYLSVKSDENKLAKILQLTARLEKYPKHDKNTADSIKILHKWLTDNPLTWETLADINKTLTYDNNFDRLIQLMRQLRNTPGSESCTACTELYEEVSALYDDDLILRRRYDRAAVLFNKLIDKKQDSIKLLPAPLNQVSRKPLFMPTANAS